MIYAPTIIDLTNCLEKALDVIYVIAKNKRQPLIDLKVIFCGY